MKPGKQSTITILAHVLFWVIYIVSEYFANLIHVLPERRWQFFQSIFLTLPILLAATYFIALFVVPRYLEKGRWYVFLGWIILVALLVFYGRIKWAELINYFQYGISDEIPVNKMLKNIIRDYAIIALGVCFSIIYDYRQKQKLNEQLNKAKADAEIKLLKSQLHPHFLFNSLNNIYSLALVKSDLTADSILKLTELLDYLVYRAGKEKVPLIKEVELVQHYMDLEKLRHGDKLAIESNIHVENENLQVAPLILLPFAENCFKHGGQSADGIFRIRVELNANDRKLDFRIVNSRPAHVAGKIKSEDSQQNGGVGLENIRQRLSLLYPGQHTLNIEETISEYRVTLAIDFRNEKV